MSSGEGSGTDLESVVTQSRRVGGTENSWCKAVPGGTGTTVLALLLSKPPDILLFRTSLHKLKDAHPILNSKLHYDHATNTFSYLTFSSPLLEIQSFDLSSTSVILQSLTDPNEASISNFHLILEHEMNRNTWIDTDTDADSDLFFATVYSLPENLWVVALRLHASICDRTTAVSLLRELLELMTMDKAGTAKEIEKKMKVNLGIEDYIPSGKANKPLWARGVDMLGYSLNSFRLSNLNFMNTVSPRSSRVVRLQMNAEDTGKILAECESREIKLFGLLAAAGLIAAHSSKNFPGDHWEKYAVVTLIDCRSILDPVLTSSHHGFYHSAILNTHDIKGGEDLWELAKRTYTSFINAKNNNKHFSDMADFNFLMCKAIENPGLTPSSSLRTSLISVFEEPVIDHSNKEHQEFGLEDYIGCASAHGVGPSIAIFDTIRDGQLDCACVFPFPLHSRDQMQDLVDKMIKILVAGNSNNE